MAQALTWERYSPGHWKKQLCKSLGLKGSKYEAMSHSNNEGFSV